MKYNKKYIAAGLLAGLTAGAGAGFILEQSGAAGASNAAQVVTVATVPVDPADPVVVAAGGDVGDDPAGGFESHVSDALQPLVADGTITQKQLDKIITALDAARPPRGEGGGDHGGRGGPGGHRGPGLEVAATALGLTVDELRTELQSGSSIADVATAHGVALQTVIDAFVTDAKAHVDAEVASGDLTQAEADSKLAEITTRITERVSTAGPLGGPGQPAGDVTPTTAG